MRAFIVYATLGVSFAQWAGHACTDVAVQALPFCNPQLPVAQRVADLLSRMNLTEKTLLMASYPGTDMCATIDPGVPRLSIPPVAQLTESNSGVSSACWTDGVEWKCPTIFPSPLNLGAAFNRTLWNSKGTVVSDEQRAFNNLGVARIHPSGDPLRPTNVSLYAFGPNINLVIDPRNGRVGEVPTEDPYLAGAYGSAYTQGLQEGEDPRYLKLIAFLKHFTAYEEETDRMGFNAAMSTFDLWDTYLPGYATSFVQGRSSGAMCSYTSLNGIPMCANGYLLTTVIREYWNQSHALVMSDCGAIENQVYAPPNGNGYSGTYGIAATRSVRAGTDVCDGTGYILKGGLPDALAAGNLTEADIDLAVSRALYLRMHAGYFDPIQAQPYMSVEPGMYGPDRINNGRAQALNEEAAAQGLVLLVNNPLPGSGSSRPVLPIDLYAPSLTSVGVLGPHAVSTAALLGDYYEDAYCPGNSTADNRTSGCVPTIGSSIGQVLEGSGRGDVEVIVAEGVDVVSPDTTHIAAALAAIQAADVVFLALGNDNAHVEHEGVDRPGFSLPGLQESFALQVLSAASQRQGGPIPVILILINAGMVAIDHLLAAPSPPAAVIEAFYPSFGAPALARSLFGVYNRWGRLPYTVYPLAYESQVAVGNLAVAAAPGRTYKYYNGTPTFAFGAGQSYTLFNLSCSSPNINSSVPLPVSGGSSLRVQVQCTSFAVSSPVGVYTGDDILLVYHRVGADVLSRVGGAHPIPVRSLVQFERVGPLTVGQGGGKVAWTLPATALGLTNAQGATVLYPGTHYIDVVPRQQAGGAQLWSLQVQVSGQDPVVLAQPPAPPAEQGWT